jgi:hypothetical protein
VVARRTLQVANGNIRGYAIPKYANAAAAPQSSEKVMPEKPVNTDKKLIATSKTKFTRTGKVSPARDTYAKAKVTANALYVRSWAGVEFNPLKSIPYIYKDKII